MASLTTPELNNLRDKKHSSKFYLSVLKPTTLLTALVNNGSIARGDRSIAYDGGAGDYASIEAGQTLWIGTTAGDNDVGTVRIRSISGSATSGTITIDENGIDWIDNLNLTVKHNYEIWPIRPSTRSGVDYKFYDTAFSDQTLRPNPVAIAGPHQAGFLSSGSLVLNVSVGDSYAIAQGASITTKVVTVSPATGASVGAEASGLIPITYTTAGTRWVKTVVSDTNGKSQTTYRVHFVYDSDNLPYNNFEVRQMSGDWDSGGWKFNVIVYGDVTLSDFPDGTACVLWREGRIDDAETYVNIWTIGDNILCSGHIKNENNQDQLGLRDGGVGQVSFSVETPEAIINNRFYGTEEVEAVSGPPANWGQYSSWLTVGRTIDFLFQWHSTVKATVDLYGLNDNTMASPGGAFTEPSLLQQANNIAGKIFGKVISDRLGRLHLSEDIQFFNDTNRNLEDSVMSITRQDLGGEVNVTRENEKRVAIAFMDGGYFDGSTTQQYVSMIGGYLDGSDPVTIPEPTGGGITDLTNKLANSQTDNDEKCGRILAAANNQLQEIRVPLRGDYVGALDIDPQLGWYVWNVANSVLNRQLELNTINMLCRRVEHEISVTQGTILSSAIFEAEAFGSDGIIADYPTTYPTPPLPSPNWEIPTADDLNISVADVAALSESQSFTTELIGSTYTSVAQPGTLWHSSDEIYMYGLNDCVSPLSEIHRYNMDTDTDEEISFDPFIAGGQVWSFQGGLYSLFQPTPYLQVKKWNGTYESWTVVHQFIPPASSDWLTTRYMAMSQTAIYVIVGRGSSAYSSSNATEAWYSTDGSAGFWVKATITENGISNVSPHLPDHDFATIDRGQEELESQQLTSYVLMRGRRLGEPSTGYGILAQLVTNGIQYIDEGIDYQDKLMGGPTHYWRWNDSASRWEYRSSVITDWDTGWTQPPLVGGNEIIPVRTFNTDQHAGYYYDSGSGDLDLHWFDPGSLTWSATGETIVQNRETVQSVHRSDLGAVVAVVPLDFSCGARFYKRDIDIP